MSLHEKLEQFADSFLISYSVAQKVKHARKTAKFFLKREKGLRMPTFI